MEKTTHVRFRSIETITALLLVAASCGFTIRCSRVDEGPPEYQSLRDLPPEQRGDRFSNYPFETQVDVYLFASTRVHPPEFGYAYDIARNGKAVLPVLNQKLREEKSQSRQERLLYVYEVMSEFFYPLKKDEEVIALVKQTISRMTSPYKERAELSLRSILEGSTAYSSAPTDR